MRSSSTLLGFVSVLVIFLIPTGEHWHAGATPNPPIDSQPLTLYQVEDHIKIAEMKIADIRSGLEKSIVWAGAPNHRTRYAIVYIHGFSASKEELRPVPDLIAASLGANIFYTRLTGHGRTVDAMREVSVSAWMQDLAEAFKVGTVIGDKVIIVSCSTGGTLVATGIANGVFLKKLSSTVFFSPNFGVRDPMAQLNMATGPILGAVDWRRAANKCAAQRSTFPLLDNFLSNGIADPDDAVDRSSQQ